MTTRPPTHQDDVRVEMGLGRDGMVEAVRLVLMAYVSLIEDNEADEATRSDARRIAHFVCSRPDVEHRLTAHAAQIFTLLGEFDAAIEVLIPLVREESSNSGPWSRATQPESLDTRFKLVAALWNAGHRVEAATEFDALARLAPDWPNTHRLAALFQPRIP